MKNKLVMLLLVIILIVGLVACNDEQETANVNSNLHQTEEIEQNYLPPIEDFCERPAVVSSTEAQLLTSLPQIDLVEYSSKTITKTYDSTILDIVISEDGVYQFIGNCEGNITIEKGVTVDLVLNSATISAVDNNAIYIKKDSIVTITVLPNTINTISNSGVDVDGKSVDTIYSKSAITINGSGQLNINSESKSSLKSSSIVCIAETTIKLSSMSHGISAASIYAQKANIEVLSAEKDGMNVDDSPLTFSYDTGYVYLNNVIYKSFTKGDGIQAASFVYIINSQLDIVTNGVFVEYSMENIAAYGLAKSDFVFELSSDNYYKVPKDLRGDASNYYALAQGCRGIRIAGFENKEKELMLGKYFVYLNASNVTIDSPDDGIKCKGGSVAIKEGSYDIASKDSGIDSDYNTTIYSGTFVINAYEAICGSYIEIQGGEFYINVRDDGINASTDDETITPYIIISGGKIDVVVTTNTGDAIDSNGKLMIEGGIITTHTIGQEAIDSEQGTWIDGGTVLGIVYMALRERVYSDNQKLTSCILNMEIAANTIVSIKRGEELIIEDVAIYSSHVLVFASDKIQNGDSIQILLNNIQVKEIAIIGAIVID